MGGGTVSNLMLDGGGVDVVHFGTTVGTTVLSGATEYVLGGAVSNTNISSGGVESIGAGYSFNTTVSGGAVEVLSGVSGVSTASDTTVLSGGELIVAGGALAIDAAVAGTEILQGDDYDSTIESGGLHGVQGRSEFTVLSGGAEEIVSSGGMAIDTTVDSGAIEIVSSGGAATGLIISSGGLAVVSSGGSAGMAVLDGGYELVASGGIMTGATISAGTLEVASGGAMASPSEVAFAGGGTLQLDGGTGFGWYVAGFGTGDQIDLRDVAFVPATTKKGAQSNLSFTQASAASGTLTVTDGVDTASIQLLGQYTASEFVAASDGHGGTLITYTSATTATTGHGHGNSIASPVTS
jgi:autotransporter passenger strand-loop-strand repeat protein